MTKYSLRDSLTIVFMVDLSKLEDLARLASALAPRAFIAQLLTLNRTCEAPMQFGALIWPILVNIFQEVRRVNKTHVLF